MRPALSIWSRPTELASAPRHLRNAGRRYGFAEKWTYGYVYDSAESRVCLVLQMSNGEVQRDESSLASDAGGVAARQGFQFQDHVAAQLVLHMIGDPQLLRVECETADDILLVWADGESQWPEYVQVKTTENDKKWSQTEICERDAGAGAVRPTSLIEKSLLADVAGSSARFRIVSRRDVNKSLSSLKTPVEAPHRVVTAVAELGQKAGQKMDDNLGHRARPRLLGTQRLLAGVRPGRGSYSTESAGSVASRRGVRSQSNARARNRDL